MNPMIIIPAYNPDHRLIELVCELILLNFTEIIIVDDGSDACCMPVFKALSRFDEVKIIHHAMNLGKGMALKTAFKHIQQYGRPCITVDADGQHAPKDILRLARQIEQNRGAIILGGRNFDDVKVPFKSKWGNKLTSMVFKWSTGRTCGDTQTGLRGFPPEMIPLLIEVEGTRYEYEMNVLLEASKMDWPFIEIPIETLYYDQNEGSHFNPVIDSMKIYGMILKYSLSAISSAAIDLGVFTLLINLFGFTPLIATVMSRLISGGYNFKMNQVHVFGSKGNGKEAFGKYSVLFMTQMLLSAFSVQLLSAVIGNPVFAKISVDTALFFMSFWIQKRYIFNGLGGKS